MPPKGKQPPPVEEPVEEPPEEPPTPPEPTEDEVTELCTGLQLPLRGVDVASIWELGEDYQGQANRIVELLHLQEAWPIRSQRQIVADFYMLNLAQAKGLCLAPRQAAVFHAMMAQILDRMRCDGVQGSTMPQDLSFDSSAAFALFQQLLLQHSIERPPEKLEIFSLSEAKMLTDFVSLTLIKHFLLYQFTVNSPQEVQTLRVRTSIPQPLPPPSLAAGRLKPKPRTHRHTPHEDVPPSGHGEEVEGEAGAKGQENADGSAEELSPEDQEIERLVAEKLKEKEAELEEKLAAREAAFLEKLAAKQAEAPPPGKKK